MLASLLGLGVLACGQNAGSLGEEPYGAPPDAPYTAEQVTLRASDGRVLAGTLTLPTASGAAPAVVMVTGSGLQDRDEHIRSVGPYYRPFRQIADTLSRRGLATLRLDDPGIGGSDPFPSDATQATYAADIGAAVAFLRERPEVDPQRVAVLGHSEGAVVAPYVASQDSLIAAMVLLAAPAYTLARVNRFQRAQGLSRGNHLTQEEVATEVERTETAAEAQARRDPWRSAAWDYDPLPTARSVRAPVLLLHGEEDRLVSPDQTDTLAVAFREGGNDAVTVRTFPGLTHFLVEEQGSDQLPAYVLGAIADWLARIVASPVAG